MEPLLVDMQNQRIQHTLSSPSNHKESPCVVVGSWTRL